MADSASRDAAAATQRLLDIMARLLGPDGCPWDRAQTHRSLLPYLLEEAYELIDAVEHDAPTAGNPAAGNPSGPVPSDFPEAAPDRNTNAGLADPAAVREELGDVLLQVVFHAGLAERAGAFDFAAVAGGLADKLVERHPHVFGGEHYDTPAQVSDAWDRRKLTGRASRLDGIPAALPALLLAAKVSSRAAKAGFEWKNTEEIYAKAHEELDEFQAAMDEARRLQGKARPAAPGERAAAAAHAELEFGDLLFSLVQLARWSGIDAEAALRRATAKFAARFRHMEQALRTQGRDPGAITEDEWWTLWAAAKKEETQP
jgi:tetrapyrrole methylase family protein/MazG family protein